MKSKNETTQISQVKTSTLDHISKRTGIYLSIILLTIILLIFFKPYVFDNLVPYGADIISAIGQNHMIQQYENQFGKRALWNPNIFLGVPIYYTIGGTSLHIDKIVMKVDNIITWRFTWFFIGALGIFWLVNVLGFPWYYGLLAMIVIIFFPHLQALIIVGHNAKIRAIFCMPYVIAGFINLIKKQKLTSVLIFALAFSLQIRTKHIQIIFYTLLLLLAIGIWQLVILIKSKEYQIIGKRLLMLLCGMSVAVLMAAQPLLIVNEYTPHSTRGGNAINLSAKAEAPEKSGGVTFDYATRWSLHPAELMTLISPRFYGGTSQETYTGDQYPQLRNRTIPGYWGHMPFTQSSEYMGIIVVILALAGIWFYRKDGFVMALYILLGFAILLAFGRHFPPLYRFLFRHLPYFSKFRVPMMILTLIQFILVILSLYGLKGFVEGFDIKKYKTLLIISGTLFVIGLVPLLNPGMLSYTSAGDAQYASNPQVLDMLKTARMEMMVQDTVRMLIFIVFFVGILSTFYFKKINRDILIVGVIILVSVDLIAVSHRFMKNAQLVKPARIEQQYFQPTKIDKILEGDPDYFRVLALGSLFQSNDLAYRYQIIGGYSAIKPQLIQDLIDNNLYTSDPQQPVNWNVVNMLNGKYILSPAQLQYEGLTILDIDQNKRTILYRNDHSLPRTWFVPTVNVLPDEKAVVTYLNHPDFDPSQMALTSEKPERLYFSTDAIVSITNYTPNQIDLTAVCQDSAFMVLSEAYYPVGWQATIAGEPTHIYQVNHVLRGIVIPPGEHDICFQFAPKSYYRSKWLSSIFVYLTWLTLLGTILYRNREKLRRRFTKGGVKSGKFQ